MFSQLVDAAPAPFFQCSQPQSPPYSPSLSMWLRGGADHADCLTIWAHAQKQYFCDDCGALVTTAGEITYHGTTETSTPCRRDSASAHSDTDSSSGSSSECSGDSGSGGGLHRGHAIRRRKRSSSVRIKSVNRVKTRSEQHVAQTPTGGSKTVKRVWALIGGSKDTAYHPC
ncbi:hypothetical protein FIBSPDRAFT_379486 [Athelia psychrophila]|uniref:C2H2-type domain-containing protein n=1 Tax=Athelia psychrophila TaxID=1759441 RepID=A0A166P3F5_9AGAM|nr:hypothetical protein FIBSPDRAFT_379486 [Fibularhizoctonia sp. CBS 109695]